MKRKDCWSWELLWYCLSPPEAYGAQQIHFSFGPVISKQVRMDTSLLNVLGSLDFRSFRVPSSNDLCYIYHGCQNLPKFAFFFVQLMKSLKPLLISIFYRIRKVILTWQILLGSIWCMQQYVWCYSLQNTHIFFRKITKHPVLYPHYKLIRKRENLWLPLCEWYTHGLTKLPSWRLFQWNRAHLSSHKWK